MTMTKRFFKLIYTLALISIGLSLPIYIIFSIQWDRITISSYKAKCLSNSEYVVLQGSPIGEATLWEETYLNSSENRIAIKEQLNFYCRYYDEIQPHIVAYNETKTPAEQVAANQRFTTFENSVVKVYAYPELYTLEPVSEETHLEEVYYPLLTWLICAVIAFLILQFIRICYVYIVFGKVIWHPFKKIETN
jgi:hypothetical protein